MPEAKALRTKGPKSSPLQMAAERRSWSCLSAESPLSAEAGTTCRRILDDRMGWIGELNLEGTVSAGATEPVEKWRKFRGKIGRAHV